MAQQIGIAGAGLLGRLLAWRLAGAGHDVTVFDPAAGPLERGAAGWTAAGMLCPWAELETADERVAELGQRSIALWAGIVEDLPQQVDFSCRGSLLLAHRSDLGAAQRMLDLLGKRLPQGRQARALSTAALAELEPSVFGPSHAWLLDGEAQIHTVQAMSALAAGATGRGVRWCWGQPVRQLSAGRIDGQSFDVVFDVRGVGARPDLAVRGVRGEIVWLHAPGLALNRPLRLLHPRHRVYLVPRRDDIIVVGASEIESEDRSPISLRSMLGLLSAAHSVIPELAEARVVHSESNLRPALPDNLPCLQTEPGLVRINGLFRHGWLIAPALVDDALRSAGLAAESLQPLERTPA